MRSEFHLLLFPALILFFIRLFSVAVTHLCKQPFARPSVPPLPHKAPLEWWAITHGCVRPDMFDLC